MRILCSAISIAFLTAVSTAHACLGVFSETRTFLDRLPPIAMSKALVARVEIISSHTEKRRMKLGKTVVENDSKITAQVRVLDAIKGTEKGKIINIDIVLTSCSK